MLICAILLIPSLSQAKLSVEITQGTVQAMPLAILSFTGTTPQTQKIGNDISKIIENDLKSSGLFNIIDPKSFIQTCVQFNLPPRFADWRLIKSQALINGTVESLPNGMMKVSFRLWDILLEQSMIFSSLQTTPKYWRRMAHLISDAIYKRITGENGYFDTRVVYISETGPQTKRKRRLAIMDQDGANHQFLTDGRYMVMTPRFSPTVQKITYMSYAKRVPHVYLLDLETGKQELVGHFPGMTFAPRFSPDGRTLIMSQAMGGSTSIYTIDLKTKAVKRLTQGYSGRIDTTPCYSPTGDKIVFVSNRSGSAQFYVMNADGSNPQRISFGSGTHETPVWSPRGDLIAFTTNKNGQFYIGVMKPDGTGERLITTGFLVEGPTWAPNGRTILFTRQEPSTPKVAGKSRVYAIDITGDNERQMPTPLDGSDPAWSPLLPLVFA
jgi:TolB protein